MTKEVFGQVRITNEIYNIFWQHTGRENGNGRLSHSFAADAQN